MLQNNAFAVSLQLDYVSSIKAVAVIIHIETDKFTLFNCISLSVNPKCNSLVVLQT